MALCASGPESGRPPRSASKNRGACGGLRWTLLVFSLPLVLPACRGCFGGGREGKSAPALPPPETPIPVEVGERPTDPIDASLLDRTPPDFTEGDRKAWRLARLLGPDYALSDAVLEVEDAEGVRTRFVHPALPVEGREPVLVRNRKGELLIAMMRADEPFPPFHGRGGNRRREGDPIRRIRGLKLLRLYENPPPP